MKTFKRNAVIITVVLFVCVAAYLNWSYNNSGEVETTAGGSGTQISETLEEGAGPEDVTGQDAGLYYNPEKTEDPAAGYFASTRINRSQARDSATETLASVSHVEGASREVIDAALEKMASIAAMSNKEVEIESLIMAKGFADCVVFISDEGVKVTVPAPSEGLSQVSVAQITDIITSETEYKAADLEIIEVK